MDVIEKAKRYADYTERAFQEDFNRKIVIERLISDNKSIMTEADSAIFQSQMLRDKTKFIFFGSFTSFLLYKLVKKQKFMTTLSPIKQMIVLGSVTFFPIANSLISYPSQSFRDLSEFYYYKYYKTATEHIIQDK